MEITNPVIDKVFDIFSYYKTGISYIFERYLFCTWLYCCVLCSI